MANHSTKFLVPLSLSFPPTRPPQVMFLPHTATNRDGPPPAAGSMLWGEGGRRLKLVAACSGSSTTAQTLPQMLACSRPFLTSTSCCTW